MGPHVSVNLRETDLLSHAELVGLRVHYFQTEDIMKCVLVRCPPPPQVLPCGGYISYSRTGNQEVLFCKLGIDLVFLSQSKNLELEIYEAIKFDCSSDANETLSLTFMDCYRLKMFQKRALRRVLDPRGRFLYLWFHASSLY